MVRMLLLGGLIGLLPLGGCDEQLARRPASDATLFGVSGMRIHPIFTQVKDWTNDNRIDGIEALIEFQDQFEDPTKASGRVIFELFEYRPNFPDPRGKRVAGPWVGSLASLQKQKQHWNRTSRTYSFQLNYPQAGTDRSYVLTAIFETTGGGRFFDRIVLGSRKRPEKSSEPTPPTTANAPGSRTSEP